MPRIKISQIRIGTGPTPNAAAVSRLADSIKEIGMHVPIAVLADGDGLFVIQAGRTRLAAHKVLGRDEIDAEVFTNALDAKLWSIAENLHRKDLSAMERAKLEDRWVKAMADKMKSCSTIVSSQVDTKLTRNEGRPEGGTNAAARAVNVPKARAHRAGKIASLSTTAQKAAERLGLDNNQRALLDAAEQRSAAAQVTSLERHAELMRHRKELRDAAPAPDGQAYPTPFQMFKAWFEMQHPGTRKHIIQWLQTLDTADLIAQLTRGILEGTDPLGGSIH